MTRVLLKTLLMAATAAIPHAPQTCIDPATSLQQLALQYDRWPQPTNATAAKAFELFRLAMESRQDADYNAAIRKYLNVGGNALRTSDPHEQLALGLLYLSSYDFAFDNTNYYRHSRARYNTNAERNAADLLTRLVQKDPHQWLAAIAIARMAILTRSGKRFEQARKAMQEVLRVEPGNTAVNLAWRDVLIAQDSIAAATTYLDAHPMDCAAAQHAQAENLMLSGDTAEGSRLYLEALDAAAPDELDRFYQDLLVMADRETLEQYDQAAPGLRSAWIRRYWERNATEFGRSLETRVADQTVRAAFADAHFMRNRVQSVVGAGGKYDASARDEFVLDSAKSLPWDIRGVMYVRHGPPLHRLRMADECAGYEAWVYVTDGDPWILAFNRRCDKAGPHDWALEQKPGCGSSSPISGTNFTSFIGARKGPPQPDVIAYALDHPDHLSKREIYQVLERFDPRWAEFAGYCIKIANGGPVPFRFQIMQQEFAIQRRHLVDSLQWGNTAFPQFLYKLDAEVATYQFRSPNGAPQVSAIAFIPMAELEARPDPIAAQRATRLQLSYALMDSVGSPSPQVKTVAVPEDQSGVLRVANTLSSLPLGAVTLHLTIRDPADSTRGVMKSRPVDIRPARTGLDVSDVVLADPGASGPLVRGPFNLAPLAYSTIHVGETTRLFFEMYGLPEGADFTETIEVTRTTQNGVGDLLKLFTGKKDTRTITFTEKAHPAAGGTVYRDVEIGGDLIPGDYTVEVTLAANGQTVKRSAALHIIKNP
jgi:tetratricopeptide (TPR) repeat protein